MVSVPRVRFAPSPTGDLHLGGARTALFNFLFARQNGGKFYLRMEDTDVRRSKQKYVDQIIAALKWLNLEWDGPTVFQSERKETQLSAVQTLLDEGKAYRCFCSVEELRSEREKAEKKGEGYRYSGKCRNLTTENIQRRLNRADPFCVRIKIPAGKITFEDRIFERIIVSNKEIDDFIIQRTDGSPTYNMSVVVDDSDMEISHVIRGDDHLTNTPKQIVIYQLLGRGAPEFAHLPMILGPDKKRLSKRHGAVGVQEFRERGYLPGALLNYMALLGWNPDTEEEVFELPELMEVFRLEQVQKKGAIYDETKLNWMNGQHMARCSTSELIERMRVLEPGWGGDEREDYLLNVLDVQRKRLKTLREIVNESEFFFEDPDTYDEKAVKKRWKDRSTNDLMTRFVDHLNMVEDWREDTLESTLRQFASENDIKPSVLIHATRLAMSGEARGPSLFLLMKMVGRDSCLRRMKKALRRLPDRPRSLSEESSTQ